MSGSVPGSRGIVACLAAAAFWAAALPAWAEAPRRVVSINVCTDQLAMALAAPGQLLSVSFLAADPRSSVMTDDARAFPLNHARAEEIFLYRPDLVLAGSYDNPATLGMLERLGVPVALFPPVTSLDEIAGQMREMGRLLGRDAEADDAARALEARLRTFRASDDGAGPRAALYFANGYTVGRSTLAGDILDSAGFRNVAAEAGLETGGNLPLEILAMAQPDLVVTGVPYPGGSRSEEILSHPVVRALTEDRPGLVIHDATWVCGTPAALDAVADLAAARVALEAGK